MSAHSVSPAILHQGSGLPVISRAVSIRPDDSGETHFHMICRSAQPSAERTDIITPAGE